MKNDTSSETEWEEEGLRGRSTVVGIGTRTNLIGERIEKRDKKNINGQREGKELREAKRCTRVRGERYCGRVKEMGGERGRNESGRNGGMLL